MNPDSSKRQFYHAFFSLYFALVAHNVVTLSVNLADNIMLGAYSEYSLSGVAAVNQVQFIFQQLVGALGDGGVIICSQYWGKRDYAPMKKIMASAMQTAAGIALVLFLAASIAPAQIVGCFTTEPGIIAEGVKYLNIIRFTYLFFAMTQILLAALRSTEVVKIALRLSIMTFCINCGMNYVLIFGRFGFPALGVSGAAIGTLTARIAEFAVLVYFVARKEQNLSLKLSDFLHSDRLLRTDFLKTALPMMVLSGLWGLNTALQTVVLGHMTPAAIAANSAASNLFLMVKSTAVGAASATAILVGKRIGAGQLTQLRQDVRRFQGIFICIGLISGTLLFFLRIPVLKLYNLSDEAMYYANAFLMILSVVCATMSYQMPVNNGIIRGGGDTAFVIRMDLISIWCIVIPISFFAAFRLKASPIAVVCCLNADQVFKCVPACLKANFGSWVRKLTR